MLKGLLDDGHVLSNWAESRFTHQKLQQWFNYGPSEKEYVWLYSGAGNEIKELNVATLVY